MARFVRKPEAVEGVQFNGTNAEFIVIWAQSTDVQCFGGGNLQVRYPPGVYRRVDPGHWVLRTPEYDFSILSPEQLDRDYFRVS